MDSHTFFWSLARTISRPSYIVSPCISLGWEGGEEVAPLWWLSLVSCTILCTKIEWYRLDSWKMCRISAGRRTAASQGYSFNRINRRLRYASPAVRTGGKNSSRAKGLRRPFGRLRLSRLEKHPIPWEWTLRAIICWNVSRKLLPPHGCWTQRAFPTKVTLLCLRPTHWLIRSFLIEFSR